MVGVFSACGQRKKSSVSNIGESEKMSKTVLTIEK